MSSSGGLNNAPLRQNIAFNWAFLIELIVCGVLTLFFLFYFNRVFAALISYTLRVWTWHRYRVYVDIEALQISLLGGRVFFKGLRYHGNNETIFIQTGYVTWVYWLRNVRQLDIHKGPESGVRRTSPDSEKVSGNGEGKVVEDGEAEGGSPAQRTLPCRLQVSLSGVEWFVYNRSAAYDAVIAGLAFQSEDVTGPTVPNADDGHQDGDLRHRNKPKESEEDGSQNPEAASARSNNLSSEAEKGTPLLGTGEKVDNASPLRTDTDASSNSPRLNTEDSFVLRFLPIHIECEKAAVVLGNQNTKSVLITKFERASGEIDASSSTGLDQYRQLINFQFEHPVIQMKPNDDYKEDQTTAASRIKRGEGEMLDHPVDNHHTRSFVHRQRRKAWHKLQDLVPAFRSSVESISSSLKGPTGTHPQAQAGSNSWQGLSRYLDENEQDDKARWSSIEYATVSTIVDSPEASMSFYWDVVGTVQQLHQGKGTNLHQNINGDIPPEWGINLSLKGATINYGPWADRQRADIQRVFFPSLCKDATPSRRLVPGQFRVPTEFKLCIDFDEETTLRVPIREESKNWKWTRQADTLGAKPGDQKREGKNNRKRKADKSNPSPEVRPFGWLDVKVGANAAVRYQMDMVAGQNGFSNKLELDLPNTEITTSVNHGILWRSIDNRISCDLSNPLQWNGERPWKFDILSNGLELFILREHVFLLIDLVDDWAGGPPPEYLTFTPFEYLVKLRLNDFRLYLNVNDSNIINSPSDFDDNTFVVIFGSVLNADISIPIRNYRPYRNDISFKVDAKHGGLNLHVPPWNTQATFLTSTELATLKELAIVGKYQYCSTTSTSNTDTLLLDVHGNSAVARFYGFVIRYYLKIKDNYFGDDIRFKTLEEYQGVLRLRREVLEDDPVPRPPHKKSNDLDVILSVSADDSTVILPSNLYSAKHHIRIEIASLAADLRFTNYYMDLDVVLSTLAFSQASGLDGSMTPGSSNSGTQLFVDGINASGNRLFGLPPTEPTYVCNWEFAIGTVTGECTAEFLVRLVSGGRAFASSFDDDENALPSISEEILHDVTFLRASITSLRLWLHVEDAAFLLATGGISVNFSDWANSHFSKKLKLFIPELKLACVDAESASRHRSRSQFPVETHAVLQTTISVAVIQRKLGFEKDRLLQQEHIKRHDQRTHRAKFLLHNHLLDDSMLVPVDPPAMFPPPMPVPVVRDSGNLKGSSNISKRPGSRKLGRKSSFLSMASSSNKSDASILRTQTALPSVESNTMNTRSRSLHTSAGPGRRIPLRDMSTSTGRQSSFYSAVGDPRGVPPSTVTFSSSYMGPYFPLEGVEPDMRDFPAVSNTPNDRRQRLEADLGLDDVASDRITEDSAHTSVIVDLPDGLGGVFNPLAAQAVANLISSLQAFDPTDILDELQIDSMSEIFKMQKEKLLNGSILDFGFRAPSINMRFLNSSTEEIVPKTDDQYDLSMYGLRTTLRSETTLNEEAIGGVNKSSTLHLALQSVGITAKDQYIDLDDPQAAVNCVLHDVVVWAVAKKETQANLSLQDFELSTISSKIEYLASLLHRTEAIGSELAETFATRLKQQRNRLRLFTYLVATAGQGATDPLFLTRPSYVLRSATDHLRICDSWKIVTRLRHIFTSLDNASQRDISTRCFSNTENVPDDARGQIVAAFDRWRSWDLNDINSCLVMKKVYGLQPGEVIPLSLEHPFNLSVRVEAIRLVIDPGPKQNEIVVTEVTLLLENRIAASAEDIGAQAQVQKVQTTIAEVFLADASVNLNWELCELADDIARFSLADRSQPKAEKSVALAPSPSGPSKIIHDLQVIVVMGKASITIDTINIRAASISNGLKASFAMVDSAGGDGGRSASLVIAADAATSRVTSHSEELSAIQLRFPSVYASYQQRPGHDQQINGLRIAGNCQQLTFDLKQDILALMEVADLVIGDEMMRIHRLIQRMPKAARPAPTFGLQAVTPEAGSRTKIHIALFLDMYEINIPLLQSLKYNVKGVVARASLGAQLYSEVVFDFDLKENSHDVQTVSGKKSTSISLLQIPPTNGRITYRPSKEGNVLSVFASVEPVNFDAAAIHSLLTAINRPEISSVIADVQEEVNVIQNHLEEIFSPRKGTPKPSLVKSKPFIYDAHLTLAGFDIFANAQGSEKDRKTARLDLNLGCIQLVVSNRLEHDGPVLEYPELRMSLRHTMFELSRWKDDAIEPCGNLSFMAALTATSKLNESGHEVRLFHVKSDGLEINLFADTASTVVDVLGHLQNKIKDIDLSREKNYLRKLRRSRPRIAINDGEDSSDESMSGSTILFESMYSLELLNIQVSWLVGTYESRPYLAAENENLVISLKRVDLSTRRQNSARLTIEDLQVQMVPATWQDKTQRSLNSALLPEVIFNVGYVSAAETRRLAFQAAGKSLDLRLTSQFMIPASELQKSIGSAAEKFRAASATWTTPALAPSVDTSRRQPFFGKKRMESLLIDADFAGAVVYLSGKRSSDTSVSGLRSNNNPLPGKYGQFSSADASSSTSLRAPGLAWKVEYKDNGIDDPSLNAEVKVHASSNILYPSIVPLVMEMSSTVKDIVSDDDKKENTRESKPAPQKFMGADDSNILTTDPSAVLGRTRLNLGLRICKQDFSLSCQPIARVAATARFEDIYLTVNTVRSTEHGHFFAASAAITKLETSVQHVYSRESTGSFNIDSVFLSLMNSKHVSGTSGLSAILKISPMKVLVNAKQIQDFLLFREIWVPPEIRQTSPSAAPSSPNVESQTFLVQRYQQVAATGAFPWNATVSIAELDVQLDLGQAIGKSAFKISNFWISSKKNSDWEQNLCLGFEEVGVDSTGRMSGFISLQDFKLRTSIQWPAREMALNQTPLVQASMGFSQFRVKAAFDYQAFLVSDITSFQFLMYNVRNTLTAKGDRLVAILDGQAVQVFCTTTTASQALALYQAFQRLIQEKRTNYQASLEEIERFMKRKLSGAIPSPQKQPLETVHEKTPANSPISLHTDVIVTLKAVNIGAFPNTFSDHQVFKLEALDAQARFATTMDYAKTERPDDHDQIHSILGLTLGQLRIGLAAVKEVDMPKSVDDISVEAVVASATGSRGGTILKVPKVECTMQTWQVPSSNHIEYMFKSAFEGKVEVGWNYSRISYIRNMWASHSKALAQRLGKPLQPSAVKITGVPGDDEKERKDGEQQKITAEVYVPQSKYDYHALTTPIIETPQLRDMGEATPPLEWVGFHRDKLPNLTHQIVIVTLLELASEVEDAYGKILGSS